MKKKNICINILPAIIWLGLFVCAFVSKVFKVEEIGNFIGLGYIFLLFLLPIFYGICNYYLANELKLMFKLYAISFSSQLVGLALNGVLHYCFISSDSETSLVIQVYFLITLICTAIIDLIAILIKMLANKIRK